jgi:hypothetical protein
MSLSSSSSSGDPDQLLLRWSDDSSSPSREEFVDVLSRQLSKIFVRSACQLAEDTPVFLAGRKYSANGRAGSCQKEASSFILGILIDNESHIQLESDWDPGVLVIDDFLTEEQEDAILANLDSSGPGSISCFPPDSATFIF